MKTERQAKFWKNRIEFFNDGEIRTIKVAQHKGLTLVRFVEVLAVVKDNLALHLTINQKETLSDDYLTITHFQSGMIGHIVHKTNYDYDYVDLNERVREAWENWYPEGSSIRRSQGFPEFGDVNY